LHGSGDLYPLSSRWFKYLTTSLLGRAISPHSLLPVNTVILHIGQPGTDALGGVGHCGQNHTGDVAYNHRL